MFEDIYKRIRVEHVLIFIAVLIGFVLRVVQLGATPLTNREAAVALQALEIARSNPVVVGPEAGYSTFTGLIMFVVGSSNFMARLIPLLFGTALILVPLLYARFLDRKALIALSFLIALDPGLIAASRAAGGITMALLGVAAGVGFFLRRDMLAAGIFGAFALLGGPFAWACGLVLGIAILWQAVASNRKAGDDEEAGATEENPKRDWKGFLFGLGIIVISIGTAFLLEPTGLSGIGQGVVDFFKGWAGQSSLDTPIIVLAGLAGLVTSYPLVVVGGIAALIASIKQNDPVTRFAAKIFLLAALFFVIYPARSNYHVILVALPLEIMVARLVDRWFKKPEEYVVATLAHFLLCTALLVFAWMDLLFVLQVGDPAMADSQLRIVALIISLVLVMLVSILMIWGWSSKIPSIGLLWCLTLLLGVLSLSSSIHSMGLSYGAQNSFWVSGDYILEGNLFKRVLSEDSIYQTGEASEIKLVSTITDSPSLRWLLKDFPAVEYQPVLSPDSAPGNVITNDVTTPVLSASYRGEDFVLYSRPTWDLMTGLEWVKWAVFHVAPAQRQGIILWTDNALFPLNEESSGQ